MTKGVYVILVRLQSARDIQVGKRFRIRFERGFYGYLGSAQSGLERRLARHLRAGKKLHWHIDYLLDCAPVQEVIYAETSEKNECLIAEALLRRLPPIPAFGCSDCRCASHLFFSPGLNALRDHVSGSFKELNLNPVFSSPSNFSGAKARGCHGMPF